MSNKSNTDFPKTVAGSSDSMRQIGICSTCNQLKECSSKRTWSPPVFFCEEFDDYSSPHAPFKSHEEVRIDPLSAENGELNYKGLCVNCEHRKTCALPRPEGGVWHCEEYQ